MTAQRRRRGAPVILETGEEFIPIHWTWRRRIRAVLAWRPTALEAFAAFGITALVVIALLSRSQDRFGFLLGALLASFFWAAWAVVERAEHER